MRVLAPAYRGSPLLVALVTCVAFLPAGWNGFVNWDDGTLLVSNPAYRGVGWPQLRWMFTTVLLGHYVPLTWLTLGLDYVVWGMMPAGYHLTSVLLHATNAGLFYVLGRRLLARATTLSGGALTTGAVAAALFFALHPLRVESVAWVTARRDVLSGTLFLATVLLYLRAAEADGRRRRWFLSASVAAYALALGAKSIVMTLPVVLLLLDVYPLRRLPAGPPRLTGDAGRVWLEKVPYLLLTVLGGVVAYRAQTYGAPHDPYPWAWRFGNVLYSLWFYLVKTVAPVGLSPLYEAPVSAHAIDPRFVVSAVALTAAGVLVFLSRITRPAGPALLLYYGVSLAPVSGIIPMGFQLVADRYTYLACLGWALLVGAAAGAWAQAWEHVRRPPWPAWLGCALVAGWLLGLGVLTGYQTRIWRDSGTLWRHALVVDPDCSICHAQLGSWLLEMNAPAAALVQFEACVTLRPDRVRVRATMADALVKLGRDAEAVDQYRRVLARDGDALPIRVRLVGALMRLGLTADAVAELKDAARVGPAQDVADFLRGEMTRQPEAAILRVGLTHSYLALGRVDLAREQFGALRVLSPDLAEARGDPFLAR